MVASDNSCSKKQAKKLILSSSYYVQSEQNVKFEIDFLYLKTLPHCALTEQIQLNNAWQNCMLKRSTSS